MPGYGRRGQKARKTEQPKLEPERIALREEYARRVDSGAFGPGRLSSLPARIAALRTLHAAGDSLPLDEERALAQIALGDGEEG